MLLCDELANLLVPRPRVIEFIWYVAERKAQQRTSCGGCHSAAQRAALRDCQTHRWLRCEPYSCGSTTMVGRCLNTWHRILQRACYTSSENGTIMSLHDTTTGVMILKDDATCRSQTTRAYACQDSNHYGTVQQIENDTSEASRS